MKLIILIFLVLAVTTIAKNTKGKTHHKKNHKLNQNFDSKQSIASASAPSLQPSHISETFYGGNPNTLPKDRHFLWKDFKNNAYGRPFYHGVVGPQWRVPVPESDSPYKTISSPIPGGDYHNRIIANDLPYNSHSHSNWDMPKRKDVVQIDLPLSSVHTSEAYVDPRFPPKGLVGTVSGTQYHNTGTNNPQLNFGNNNSPTASGPQTSNGEFSFAEKKHKKKFHIKRANLKTPFSIKEGLSAVEEARKSALSQAVEAQQIADGLISAVAPHPENVGYSGAMKLDIQLKNRVDENHGKTTPEIEKALEFWRNQPQGIRAMHTKPFLPKSS